jgi:hypothetical protein
MKTLELVKDNYGRRTIIVPDGMEVVVKDNGDLMLVEKHDIFETLKPGDVFASKDGVYIFKSLNRTSGQRDCINVYGYVQYDGKWSVEETTHEFLEPVFNATSDGLFTLKDELSKHCYEWNPDTLEFIKIPWVPQYGDTYFEIDDSDSGCARVEKCSFANGTPKSKFPVFPSRREAEKWAHEYDVLLNQFIGRIINEADMEHSEDY